MWCILEGREINGGESASKKGPLAWLEEMQSGVGVISADNDVNFRYGPLRLAHAIWGKLSHSSPFLFPPDSHYSNGNDFDMLWRVPCFPDANNEFCQNHTMVTFSTPKALKPLWKLWIGKVGLQGHVFLSYIFVIRIQSWLWRALNALVFA